MRPHLEDLRSLHKAYITHKGNRKSGTNAISNGGKKKKLS